MFLQGIDAPSCRFLQIKEVNQKFPPNDVYSTQNSTFSHTKEYIILIKIH